jgi:hypothetical protein
MFISQYEIDHRKAHAQGEVKVLYGKAAIYYHLVDDVSSNPDKPPLQVCGTPALIAGVKGEMGMVPYYLDLAFHTQVEGVYMLVENLPVESLGVEGPDQAKIGIAVVEYANAARIISAVNQDADSSVSTVKPKRNHLTLVVDNENTVEKLIEDVNPTLELTYEGLIRLMEEYISKSLMPSAKKTHYNHRVPRAIKAEDDGHFLRILREQEKSGFYYRDALRRGETYAALVVDQYVFIVGLRSHFTVYSERGGDRFHDMHEKSFKVSRTALTELLKRL